VGEGENGGPNCAGEGWIKHSWLFREEKEVSGHGRGKESEVRKRATSKIAAG